MTYIIFYYYYLTFILLQPLYYTIPPKSACFHYNNLDACNIIYTIIKVGAYDQEIPQLYTAEQQTTGSTVKKSKKQQLTVTRHHKTNLGKATCSLFPIKMIAKLEKTVLHKTRTKHRDPTNNGSNNKH